MSCLIWWICWALPQITYECNKTREKNTETDSIVGCWSWDKAHTLCHPLVHSHAHPIACQATEEHISKKVSITIIPWKADARVSIWKVCVSLSTHLNPPHISTHLSVAAAVIIFLDSKTHVYVNISMCIYLIEDSSPNYVDIMNWHGRLCVAVQLEFKRSL